MNDAREAVIVAVGYGKRVTVMDEENDRNITREEVQDALSKMGIGKTPGLDDRYMECLKKGVWSGW